MTFAKFFSTQGIALILSLLLHLFVLKFFILILPIQTTAPRPLLIFLGALLETYDLKILTPQETPSSSTPEGLITIQMPNSKFHTADSFFPSKPSCAKSFPPLLKRTLKFSFLEDHSDDDEDLQPLPNSPEINSEGVKYIPLKFRLR